MKTCPYCGSSEYKTLLKGRYPRCCVKRRKAKFGSADLAEFMESRQVSTVMGKWHKRAPIYRVLAEFERRMATPGQHGRYYRLHPKEHAALIPPIVTLLNRLDWDEELALAFIDVRFEEWFKNKPCDSIYQVIAAHSFSLHAAKARKRLEAQEKAEKLQEAAIIRANQNRGFAHNVYASLETM